MVRFDFEGKIYKIGFYYIWRLRKSAGLRSDFPKVTPKGLRRTSCFCEIHESIPGKEETLARMNISACHPKDEFNKDIARRMALGRAIDGDTPGFKAACWNAYSRMKGRG